MDPVIKQKILDEINQHTQQELKGIEAFCIQTQAKQHLSIYSLGKAIAQKFNLTETAGIKLANAFNRYLL